MSHTIYILLVSIIYIISYILYTIYYIMYTLHYILAYIQHNGCVSLENSRHGVTSQKTHISVSHVQLIISFNSLKANMKLSYV